MASDAEMLIQMILEKNGLMAKRFSKDDMKLGKTPDFKVFKDGSLQFYCEVKNLQKDNWLDDAIDIVAPGELAGGLRNDPVFNRLTAHIHQASKQFHTVNPECIVPNVLALYNEDKNSDIDDLMAVTTGNFYSTYNSIHPIYKSYSEGRIKNDIANIHLFIWFDKTSAPIYRFNNLILDDPNVLLSLFNYNQNAH